MLKRKDPNAWVRAGTEADRSPGYIRLAKECVRRGSTVSRTTSQLKSTLDDMITANDKLTNRSNNREACLVVRIPSDRVHAR